MTVATDDARRIIMTCGRQWLSIEEHSNVAHCSRRQALGRQAAVQESVAGNRAAQDRDGRADYFIFFHNSRGAGTGSSDSIAITVVCAAGS